MWGLVLLLAPLLMTAADPEAILGAFVAHQVIPDVLPSAPKGYVHVRFESGAEANLGAELLVSEVHSTPQLEWEADPEKLYTLIMPDADAPDRETRAESEYLHWLVINIRGSDVSSGDTLASFLASGPPADSGFHRYLFLLYEQPGPLNIEDLSFTEPQDRAFFSTVQFAKEYGLGEPLYGNFYTAQNEGNA